MAMTIQILLLLSIFPRSVDAFSSTTTCTTGRPFVAHHHQITSSSSQHVAQFSSTLQLFHPSLVTLASSSSSTGDSDDDTAALSTGVDKIFTTIDIDGSGTIDLDEYDLALSSTQYSDEDIQRSFHEMDSDGNGEISKDEFQKAITKIKMEKEGGSATDMSDSDDCPMGYWLNSVEQTCQPLGPIGRVSQKIETLGPFKDLYKRITNLFGVNKQAIRKNGVSFALAYSIISNMNGALSLSVAWYMTVKRTGLSPLAPGQKKSLLASYAMIYGALQLLKPFRVAAAIAMSKLSAEYLEMTQERFNCSRGVAIGCQYMMGQLMMGITFFVGVTIVSMLTGVPIRG